MQPNETSTSSVLLNGEQPKQEMTALAQKAKYLRDMLVEANEAGDGKAFEKYTKQLKETNKQINQMAKEAFDVKKVLDNLSGASIKDLEAAQKRLNATLRSGDIARNSDEWEKLQSQLKKVRQEIYNVNAENRASESGFSNLANGINKYFAMFTAGVAAVTGLTFALKKFIDMRNELEDSKANLKALTGLGDADVSKLESYAQEMATKPLEGTKIRIRATVAQIIEAYKLVGSAKPELLKTPEALNEVTKQSMILAAAAGMPLSDAVHGTVIALNQYSAGADQAAKYVNVLAAGSQAGAQEVPYISEALVKFGAVAKLSNIPIEQSVALIEAIGEKGFQAEVTGTGLKTFFTKLMAGANETNPAIVGMDMALENLNKKFSKAGGFSEMVKLFGQDNVVVAQTLIANRARFTELTKAVTGTNTAIDQATTTSATNAAKMAQAQNQFALYGMELVKNLNPAMINATNLGNDFLKVLIKSPGWLKENAGLLATLSIVMIAYTVAVGYNTIAKKANDLATKALDSSTAKFFKTLLTNPYVAMGVLLAGITVLFYKLATAQSAAEKAWKEYNKQSAVEVNNANQLFEAAKKTKEGTAERKTIIDKINSVYGQYLSNQLTDKSNLEAITKAQNEANTALREKLAIQIKDQAKADVITQRTPLQANLMDRLSNKVTSEKGVNFSDAIMDQVKQILDKNIPVDPKKAYNEAKNYLKKMMGSGMKDSMYSDLGEYVSSLTNMNKELSEIDKRFDRILPKTKPVKTTVITPPLNTQNDTGMFGGDTKELQKAELDQVDRWMAKEHAKFKNRYLQNLDDEETYQKNILNVTREGLVWKQSLYTQKDKEYFEYKNQIADIDIKLQTDAEKLSLKAMKELQDQRLNAIAIYDNLSREELNQKLEDDLITQKEYDNSIMALDKVLAEARLDAAKEHRRDVDSFQFKSNADRVAAELAANKEIEDAAKNLSDVEKKIYHQKISDRKEIEKQISEIEKKYGIDDHNSKQKEYANALSELKTAYQAQLLLYENDEKKKREITERYEKDVTKIKVKQAEQTAQEISEIMTAASNLSQTLQESETLAVDNKYAEQLKAAKAAGKDTTALEAQIEEEKKQIKKKYADIDFAITVGQIIANTALAVMKAAPNIPLQVLEGILGAAQLGVAVKQREATKNLWTGGFTDPGDKYKPAGIVHAGEFVANQEAVRSAPMRKVFNLVDYAQRTNTIARITSEDISRAVGIRQGLSSGSNSITTNGSSSGSSVVNVDLSLIRETMAQTNAINAMLVAELKKGIGVKMSGNNGIAKVTEDYNRLLKNAGK